jgi:hypothetical protein
MLRDLNESPPRFLLSAVPAGVMLSGQTTVRLPDVPDTLFLRGTGRFGES